MESAFRKKYNANIIGIKINGNSMEMANPEYVFNKEDHIVVVAKTKDFEKYL